MWIVIKFVTAAPTDGGSARIPTLKVKDPNGTIWEVADNAGKSKALYDSFFYPPPADAGIDPDFTYPPAKFKFKPISDAQVLRAIKKLKPYKAPGPDGISNSVFTHCADLLVPWLGILFRATFELSYYPDPWKIYDTLVMRKPGKPDYSLPKAHRPVAQCKTTPKILSSCIGDTFIFYAEKLGLLPETHFGCRPGRTATDSLHYLVKWVRDSLRKGLVVSALCLDIQGAFPNTVIPRLIHNLRVRGIPEEYTEWIQRRVQGRRTTLCFDDYRSEMFEVLNGLDQGCPASGPLYIFYNADLIDIPISKDELASAFVDDCIVAARAPSVQESNERVVNMVTRPKGALEWSHNHVSKFELDKTGLIVFTNRRIPDPARPNKTIALHRPSVTINGQEIKASQSLKFLGVILDQELRFKAQADHAAAKGKFWITQTRRISKTTKGIKSHISRQLYKAAAVPAMMYGASIWLTPIVRSTVRGKRSKGSIGAATKLAKVQRMAAIHITGAMRTTATDVLDAHADLLTMDLLIDKHCFREALRLATLPKSHPLYSHVKAAAKHKPRKHPSPLHEIMHAYSIDPTTIETITPVRHAPSWTSPVTTRIAPDRKTAIDEEERDNADIRIYTDGSGFEGKVGAGAVLYRCGVRKGRLRYRLGELTEHTVYEGELVGLNLGAELLRKETRVKDVSIYTDNQASIQALESFKPTPGHYIADEFLRMISNIRKRFTRCKIRISWIPGHEDVQGNEDADDIAKKAATDGSSHNAALPSFLRKINTLPLSKSALKQKFDAELKAENSSIFAKSPRCNALRRIDETAPSAAFQKLIRDIPRRHASILAQLRTGHIPLNKHLHRIGRAASPTCPVCEGGQESVLHFLVSCPAHEPFRRHLRKALKRHASSVNVLLNDPEAIRPLFRYINKTGRLRDTFGNTELPPEDDRRNT